MRLKRESARHVIDDALDRMDPEAYIEISEAKPPAAGTAARITIAYAAIEGAEIRTDEPAGTPIEGTAPHDDNSPDAGE